MLMYRTCRCCRRIWNKLLHTVFHILSIPCIAIAFIAVLDSHNLRTVEGNPAPIPNFYSLHSWIGLAAMGLFALQVIFLAKSTQYIPVGTTWVGLTRMAVFHHLSHLASHFCLISISPSRIMQTVEPSTFKSTQPKFESKWSTLYSKMDWYRMPMVLLLPITSSA